MMQDQAAQSYSLLETQLIDAIADSLQNGIPSNATFLAQRLLAERDTQEVRTLLADCYMAQNKHYRVHYLLKDCKNEMSRYKCALGCIKAGKYKEADKALLGGIDIAKVSKNLDLVANGSYGIYLLGVSAEKQQKYPDAKQYYGKALELNPTLWSAYEKLGKLGQNIIPNKVFSETKMKNFEATNIKKSAVSNLKRRKEEEEKIKKSTQSQFPKRKNSIHSPDQTFTSLMPLLKKLADGHYSLCQYNCLEAVEEFKRLPPNHYNTGWVQTSIGRAYIQIVKYVEAAQHFELAYKLEPFKMEGIEHYSSCLWQLKKNVELCYLAHQALDKSLYAPEAWIAVGNCFSLQKEHEQALKFFNRAIQLNSQNAYAYTLCGHQHVYNEDFKNAKRNFESAVNIDMRHYSAWWGMGNISYKQEKYDKAAQSFNRAIVINSKNPVLYTFMGMTLAANRQYGEALKYYQKSQGIDPKSSHNKYQKATTLVKLQKYDEAVQELQNLQSLMPKEAPIPMMLGKIYKKLGKTDKAHYYFSLALDLQSKDGQKIKGYIESLHNTGNDADQMEL